MSKADYALLQDVLMDADFPDLDLALRRGRHVDRDDGAWYALLSDAQELLEPFYRRYGCELIHKTDGYFYLLPTGDKVSRKQLSATDMLVGQALALLYLDPAAVERGGVVTQEEVVGQLSAVLGTDTLIAAFNPGKRKSKDERIAQRNVRQRAAEAVRRLAGLGFVELSDASSVRLRSALLRFAEPVRGMSEPAEALAKLVAQGEVALAPEEAGEEVDELDADAAAEEVGAESGERVDRAAAAASGGSSVRAERQVFAETLSGFTGAPDAELDVDEAALGGAAGAQLSAADGGEAELQLSAAGGEAGSATDDAPDLAPGMQLLAARGGASSAKGSAPDLGETAHGMPSSERIPNAESGARYFGEAWEGAGSSDRMAAAELGDRDFGGASERARSSERVAVGELGATELGGAAEGSRSSGRIAVGESEEGELGEAAQGWPSSERVATAESGASEFCDAVEGAESRHSDVRMLQPSAAVVLGSREAGPGPQAAQGFAEADETAVRKRPDAVEVEHEGAELGALVEKSNAADGGGDVEREPEDDGELDWADILVPDTASEDEEAS